MSSENIKNLALLSIIKMSHIKSSYFVIICFLLTANILHAKQMESEPIKEQGTLREGENQKFSQKYEYLHPSNKLEGGWFKNYEFDLRFPEIKDSMISKNLFQGAIEFLGFKFSHETVGKKKPKNDQDFQLIEQELPMVPTNFKQHTEKDIRYTWIGHSTAVIQVGPDNFLIDPIFGEKKVSKRYRPPACKINQLPKIDAVLISHDHYDHLDCKSTQEIQELFEPIFIAGLGTDDTLPKGSRMRLMDWMDQITLKLKGGQYRVTFVPACHWARRGIADLNTRLWGGFIIETPFGHKIYYSGDTGYCGLFKEIGAMFGPFDLSVLPIGAYEPRELLKPQHISPEEAVRIHKQVGSKQSVAVHWGTLSMGREGFAQPKYDLIKACELQGLKEGEFVTLKHGESRIF